MLVPQDVYLERADDKPNVHYKRNLRIVLRNTNADEDEVRRRNVTRRLGTLVVPLTTGGQQKQQTVSL